MTELFSNNDSMLFLVFVLAGLFYTMWYSIKNICFKTSSIRVILLKLCYGLLSGIILGGIGYMIAQAGIESNDVEYTGYKLPVVINLDFLEHYDFVLWFLFAFGMVVILDKFIPSFYGPMRARVDRA